MASGVVKKVFPDRGFGFIAIDGESGKDIFFHAKGCQAGAFDALKVGDAVTFEVDDKPDRQGRGPRAINVVKTA